MKSILNEIKKKIESINWNSEVKKQRAFDVCIAIYNLYIYDGGDFYSYRSLSKEFFQKIIRTNNYLYEIKNALIDNGILEMHNSYDVNKGIGKGYRFNKELIKGGYIKVGDSIMEDSNQNFDIQNDYSFNYILNKIPLYHNCRTIIKDRLHNDLQRLTFDNSVHDWINNFKINPNDIIIDNSIQSEYINIVFENQSYRYRTENGLKLAKEQGKNLIQYKDKSYIEDVNEFIKRKESDLKLVYSKSVFDIENGLFRISRNSTNRRLDYNLTNIKGELLNYLRIDGERLVELDIANAQFSIFSYLCSDYLDHDFIELCEEGRLYEVIDKEKMFRIAFDKVRSNQNDARKKFPLMMNYVDEFKKINGYKSFSQLLQNAESMIMIDGLVSKLYELDFSIFPIHDAIRVKESQIQMVKDQIEKFFHEIGFKCTLRIKNGKK